MIKRVPKNLNRRYGAKALSTRRLSAACAEVLESRLMLFAWEWGGTVGDDYIVLLTQGTDYVLTNNGIEQERYPIANFASSSDTIRINGYGGNDRIEASTAVRFPCRLDGGEGDDVIFGGSGDDYLDGGSGYGRDLIYGREGKDSLLGGFNDDTLYGGPGDDTLNGDDGADTLWGGDDNDELNGGAENDQLHGEGGTHNTLNGGSGNDTLYASVGGNELNGGSENDLIFGSPLNDSLNGDDGADTLWGYEGNDVLYGGTGTDLLYGGMGNDQLYGESGNDTLVGGVGGVDDDFLYGGSESDLIFGDEWATYGNGGYGGTDLIEAGSGNDTVYGGGGADVIRGGSGADLLYGDYQQLVTGLLHRTDVVFQDHQEGSDWIYGDDGNDTLYGDSHPEGYWINELNGYGYWIGYGDDHLEGGRDSDLIWGEGGFEMSGFMVGEGNDVIEGGYSGYVGGEDPAPGDNGGNDTLNGEAGDDTYVFRLVNNWNSLGCDWINEDPTNEGRDKLDFSGLAIGTGVQVDIGSTVQQTVCGLNLSLVLSSGIAIQDVKGTDSNDRITGNGGANVLDAYMGQDTLIGAGGSDTLNGCNDDDADSLDGGGGIDTGAYDWRDSVISVELP